MTPEEFDAGRRQLRERERARIEEQHRWAAEKRAEVAALADLADRAEMTAMLDQFEALLDDPENRLPPLGP